MVRIYECSFCNKEIEPGTGTMLVTRDSVLRFDSRKCKRSHEMKRDARKLKWTTKYERKIVTAEELAAKSKAKKSSATTSAKAAAKTAKRAARKAAKKETKK
jgi:large subunit ribosomal protein L24e